MQTTVESPVLRSRTFLYLLIALLAPLALGPVAAGAQTAPTSPLAVWAIVTAGALGNYPGGNEVFSVFVVNSAPNPTENFTVENMTITTPFGSNTAIGLPTTLDQGQSIFSTIALQIPANYAQNSFTGNLVVNGRLFNGTAFLTVELTGSANVDVLALPSSTVSQSTSSQPTAQAGTVSDTLFEVGVFVPSALAVLFLVTLIAKGSKKGT